GSSFTATYRAYVSGGQPAGTYDGKVKYIMVHPATNVPNEPKDCSANKICYWPNAGNTVADRMGDQSITASSTSADLWASNFERPGYGFAGWSDAYDYVVNEGSESNPNAHIYGPNETIEFTAGAYSSKGLPLYAVWVSSEGNLQNWNGCSTLPQGKVTALTDTRDNDTYAVAKLADGKCWMIENLRLDTADSLDETKSSTGAYGGVFSGLANPEVSNFSNTTPVVNNSRYTSDGTGSTYNPITNPVTLTDLGTTNRPEYRMPRYRNDNTNTDATLNPNVNVANMTGADQNVYSYGNYYTWHSAIVDTTVYASNNTSVNTSLCPTGWRLPKGGNKSNEANNEFWRLIVNGINGGVKPANYDSSTTPYYDGVVEAGPVDKKIRAWPNNFLYSGGVGNSSINSRGSYGIYWSATACGSSGANSLDFYGSRVYPGANFFNKYFGSTLRCLIGSS
ncbi:hypothetical protein IIY24_01380, partial [Candidatus Saccharibacteria bacterium]|nr:hypothetical protein [Candidatus Saccharibacteria bacterium]